MTTKNKYISLTMITILMFFMIILGLNVKSVFAFNGIPNNLTEQELYNETNTYNVSVTTSTTDSDRINNTTQYSVTYNMSQKNSNQVMNTTQITVLTHGLGSKASIWSNNYSKTNNSTNFAYDGESLISKISEKVGDVKIYWAKMTGYDSFDLYDISNQKTQGAVYTTANLVDRINDISKHIIVVFEAYKYYDTNLSYKDTSLDSNNNIYYQFNYMLSKIIYDVKIANGGILPKVNLIGHSRGGLSNLQYALDHPDLVSTLVSLGTPYFASTTARLFGEWFMGGLSDGLNDILNPDIYYNYNTRWNSNYNTLYKDIDVYAIGSYHTLGSLAEAVGNDYSGYISAWGAAGISAGLGALNGWKLSSFLPYIMDRIGLAAITEMLDIIFPNSAVVDGAEIIFQEINYDSYPLFVSWYNDILVPLESQLGNDSGNVSNLNSGSYLGFNRIIRPFLTLDDNVNYEKVSQAMPPVGHNLEARDKIIIANVLSVLDLGVNTNSAYVTMDNDDGTVTFVRYNGMYENSTFIIPSAIDGKNVKAISSLAFSGQNNITEIQIPKTIKTIGSYAFAGMNNLATVAFYGTGNTQLEKIGYGAFAGCTSLTKFGQTVNTLDLNYGTLTEIGDYAFYGTAFQSVYFPLCSIGK